MDWATRRKLLYATITLSIVAFFVFLFLQKTVVKPPTCTDNRKNGTETGRDCGGICDQYCKNTFANPKVRWVRSFPVNNNFVHAVAYIEHNNQNAALPSLSYAFNFYDAKGQLITTKEGSTYVGSFGRTAIIEALVQVKGKVVDRTDFSITSTALWKKLPAGRENIVIRPERTDLDEAGVNETRLSVLLKNTARADLRDVTVTAILYDAQDNAITVSKTEAPNFQPLGKKTVYFTWPFDLDRPVARIEVLSRVNPFTQVVPQ